MHIVTRLPWSVWSVGSFFGSGSISPDLTPTCAKDTSPPWRCVPKLAQHNGNAGGGDMGVDQWWSTQRNGHIWPETVRTYPYH